MADEITITALLRCIKNGITVTGEANKSATIAGNNFGGQTFTTSTSGALVPVGGLTTYGGWFYIQNNDAAITVGIYQDGATATVKITDLAPGDFILFKPAAAVGCKAASGTPDIYAVAFEP